MYQSRCETLHHPHSHPPFLSSPFLSFAPSRPPRRNAACLSDNPNVNDNCPAVEGPDFDFGQAPMLVTPCKGGRGCRQLYVVGQKSGIVWAVDPVDGSVVWKQRAGPGGVIGGIMWVSANNPRRDRVFGGKDKQTHRCWPGPDESNKRFCFLSANTKQATDDLHTLIVAKILPRLVPSIRPSSPGSSPHLPTKPTTGLRV